MLIRYLLDLSFYLSFSFLSHFYLVCCATYFCFQLSGELEKLLSLDKIIDVGEVSKLRAEVRGLKAVKLNLDRTVVNMTKERDDFAEKVHNLLSNKS